MATLEKEYTIKFDKGRTLFFDAEEYSELYLLFQSIIISETSKPQELKDWWNIPPCSSKIKINTDGT